MEDIIAKEKFKEEMTKAIRDSIKNDIADMMNEFETLNKNINITLPGTTLHFGNVHSETYSEPKHLNVDNNTNSSNDINTLLENNMDKVLDILSNEYGLHLTKEADNNE